MALHNEFKIDQNAQYADKIADGLYWLSRAVPRLDTQGNFNTLVRYREFNQEILTALRTANVVNQALLDGSIQTINNRILEEKIAFAMGGNESLAANSVLFGIFHHNALRATKGLTKEIFDFFPKVGRS